MKLRLWIYTLGLIYFFCSGSAALMLLVKTIYTSGDKATYFFIALGLLLQGGIVLTICLSLEKIMDRQSIMYDYIKKHLPDNIAPENTIANK